jgi:predicted nucleotidyltransferase
MEMKIREKLCRLEDEKDIELINARERGSRMLGAEHDDSDWDVLFLFAQDADRYATIHGRIDSIHEPHLGEDEQIDLHGWNIDKFGELIRDSNPNAIEFCRKGAKEYIQALDPINEDFLALAKNARENFNHMSLYHHYISMGKRNWKKYIDSGNDCTKGRQFYVARSIAAAQHIRNSGTLPPMDAIRLSESACISDEMSGILQKLTLAKRAGHGEQESPDIVGELYKAESEAPMEPTDERIDSPDTEIIDDFIRTAIIR